MSLSVKNSTRRKIPKVDFLLLKEKVLGKRYELSLVFVGNSVSRRLNKTFRGKDRATNVLSFPLSKDSGEIFLDLSKCEKEHKKFGMDLKKFVTYLYIHGLLHLKGMEHGARMEKVEKKFLNEISITKDNGAANRSRH